MRAQLLPSLTPVGAESWHAFRAAVYQFWSILVVGLDLWFTLWQKQGLCNQLFTVCVFSSPFPSFPITALSFFFSAPTALPLPLFFPTCVLSSSSPSLHISSAPSGGSVASDAAGRGQPFISVTGGNLQTTLRQEGHRTWQPHFQILRSSGNCAGQRHTGQPPGMETVM